MLSFKTRGLNLSSASRHFQRNKNVGGKKLIKIKEEKKEHVEFLTAKNDGAVTIALTKISP